MTKLNTNAVVLSSDSHLSGWLAEQIESVLDHRVEDLPFSYCVPAIRTTRCIWCNRLVVPCFLASGREFDAELEIEDSIPRAVLTTPHACAEGQRHEFFVSLEDEPESSVDREDAQ